MEQTTGLAPDYGLRCQPMNVAFTNGGPNTVQGLRLVMPTGTTVVQAAGCDDLGENHSMLISAPFVAVIPAGAQLARIADNDSKGWVIALRRGVLGQASQEAFVAVPKWSRSWDPFLREAADTLSALHRVELIDAACADAFADVISVHIALYYGHCAGAAEPDTPLTRQMLSRVQAFVHEHIAETILVGQLAVLVHMGTSNFARAFKTVTGNPPHLYVTLERVKFARTMLSQQTPPLVDVGALAGFQTQQHFTEVFHRYTGVTPRAYRLARRNVSS
jgi:AraC family transcriptional regulator